MNARNKIPRIEPATLALLVAVIGAAAATFMLWGEPASQVWNLTSSFH